MKIEINTYQAYKSDNSGFPSISKSHFKRLSTNNETTYGYTEALEIIGPCYLATSWDVEQELPKNSNFPIRYNKIKDSDCLVWITINPVELKPNFYFGLLAKATSR